MILMMNPMIPVTEIDADDQRHFLDQDPYVPPTSSADLGPYAQFLADMPDWTEMFEDYYIKAFENFHFQWQALQQ
jgi:hypothetical protein